MVAGMTRKVQDDESPHSDISMSTQSKMEVKKLDIQAPPPYSAFSPQRRRVILGIVTAAGFFGPLSGAIYLPALPLFESIFSASATTINATVSVYMAVFAVAPLLWAASADYGGRKTVYFVSLGIFNFANVLLASLPPNIGALFFLRVLQALGSCGVTAVGAGTVADITETRRRASALSIFLLGPQVAPILGPLIGGQFAVPERWRWIFGFLAIACFPVYCMIIFCLPETLRCLVGNGEVHANRGWISVPSFRQPQVVDSKDFPRMPRPNLKSFYRLLQYPPNLIVMISGALLFAAFYSILITFPRVLKDTYGFSEAEVGYAYLASGIPAVIGSLAGGRTSDFLRKRAVLKHGSENIPPERRISTQIYGYILSAAGLLMYGWFCRFRIHVSAALVASAIASFGMTWVFVTSSSYQTECFPPQAASQMALASLLRNVAAAIAAVIIDRLTSSMGFGWCFTGLAFLNLLGVVGVLFIMKWGPAFRRTLEANKPSPR